MFFLDQVPVTADAFFSVSDVRPHALTIRKAMGLHERARASVVYHPDGSYTIYVTSGGRTLLAL